jgi:hypothetical protein
MMVDVHTWGLNELSDPDLYIASPKLCTSKSEAREKLGLNCCTWKSHNIGPDHVRILPADNNMVPGTYFISIIPFCDGLNQLAISLKLIQPKSQTILKKGESAEFELNESAFFRYFIQEEADLEDIYLLF